MRSRRASVVSGIRLWIRLRRAQRRLPASSCPVRPSDLSRRRRGRIRLSRSIRLRWQLHTAGWLLGGVPAVLVGGWPWVAAGPAAFEVLLFVLTLRVARRSRPNGGGRGPGAGPWGAGDREPRRPLPVAGAGAAAIPLPTEEWSAGRA